MALEFFQNSKNHSSFASLNKLLSLFHFADFISNTYLSPFPVGILSDKADGCRMLTRISHIKVAGFAHCN